MFDQLSNALPQVRSGNVKGYPIAASSRSPSAADIPSVDEVGLAGFLWRALAGALGSQGHAARGHRPGSARPLCRSLADPAIKQRLADAGQDVVAPEQQTSAALAAYQKVEAEKWWPIIKAANLKGD